MAVRIRLQRFGAKKRPYYRIVAAHSRKPRDGRFLEQLGTYNPMVDPSEIRLKVDRVNYWLSVGAQPSDTVRSLIRKYKRSNPLEAGPQVAPAQPSPAPVEKPAAVSDAAVSAE